MVAEFSKQVAERPKRIQDFQVGRCSRLPGVYGVSMQTMVLLYEPVGCSLLPLPKQAKKYAVPVL